MAHGLGLGDEINTIYVVLSGICLTFKLDFDYLIKLISSQVGIRTDDV